MSQLSPPAPDAGAAALLEQRHRYFMLAMESFRRETGHANSSERELALAFRDRCRLSGVFWHDAGQTKDISEEMFALCEA